jgi:thymidylate synthase (FAD)
MKQLAVLDKGWVQLEESMGGDAAVIRGARICYGSESSGPDADARLIQRLMKSEPKHNTVFEHAVFRWGVKCPIFVARQWMRHRIGTFNERSLRYCVASREYYVPPAPSVLHAAFCAGAEEDPSSGHPLLVDYVRHMEASLDLYEKLVAAGWRKEQARSVLGLGTYTEFIWTVNAWSLMNWLTKRLHKSAQWEHRQYALAVLQLYEEAMPLTAAAFKESVLEKVA